MITPIAYNHGMSWDGTLPLWAQWKETKDLCLRAPWIQDKVWVTKAPDRIHTPAEVVAQGGDATVKVTYPGDENLYRVPLTYVCVPCESWELLLMIHITAALTSPNCVLQVQPKTISIPVMMVVNLELLAYRPVATGPGHCYHSGLEPFSQNHAGCFQNLTDQMQWQNSNFTICLKDSTPDNGGGYICIKLQKRDSTEFKRESILVIVHNNPITPLKENNLWLHLATNVLNISSFCLHKGNNPQKNKHTE